MADYDSSLPVMTRAGEELQVITKTGSNLKVVEFNSTGVLVDIKTDTLGGLKVVEKNSTGVKVDITTDSLGGLKIKDTAGNSITAVAGAVYSNLRNSSGAELKGQKVMADSVPVVLASDQTTINVAVTSSGTTATHFKLAAGINAGSSDTHTYSAVATAFSMREVIASASGAFKCEVKAGAPGSEATVAVGFGTAGTPYIVIPFGSPISVVAGNNVLMIMTNRDKQQQDLYSTVNGYY